MYMQTLKGFEGLAVYHNSQVNSRGFIIKYTLLARTRGIKGMHMDCGCMSLLAIEEALSELALIKAAMSGGKKTLQEFI